MNNLSLLALVALAACNGDDVATMVAPTAGATLTGSITNQDSSRARLGGSGTTEAAVEAEAYGIGVDGSLALEATTNVGTDATYTFDDVDLSGWMVVQARDASGGLVASVAVEPNLEASVVAAPMTAETSAEAEVFLAADADPMTWATIQARIDGSTAAALDDDDEAIAELATSAVASYETKTHVWTREGADAEAIHDAQLQAAIRLSRALAAGETGARETFYSELVAAEEVAGVDARVRAEAETDAGLAFRTSLQANGLDDVLEASANTSAELEARAWQDASTSYLRDVGADATILASADTANAKLLTDIRTAATAEARAEAVTDWRATLIGGASTDGSLLADALDADLLLEAGLDTAVGAAADAASVLETSVLAAARVGVDEGGLDAATFASVVADRSATHRTETRVTLDGALVNGTDLDAAVDLILEVQTSFNAY